MEGFYALGAAALLANPLPETQTKPHRITHGGRKLDPLRRVLLHVQSGRCAYCPTGIDFATCTVEHVWPLNPNNERHRDRANARNVVLICQPCNTAKGHRDPTPREVDILKSIQMKRENR